MFQGGQLQPCAPKASQANDFKYVCTTAHEPHQITLMHELLWDASDINTCACTAQTIAKGKAWARNSPRVSFECYTAIQSYLQAPMSCLAAMETLHLILQPMHHGVRLPEHRQGRRCRRQSQPGQRHSRACPWEEVSWVWRVSLLVTR